MEISIRIDWISITDLSESRINTAVHPSLNDGSWEECTGKNGYNLGEKHVTGVRTYANYSREDMGRHSVYSSKALDRIKEMKDISGTDVLLHHINKGHRVVRLDLAIDFIGYDTPVGQYITAFQNGQVVTRLRKASIIKSLTNDAETLYLGSMKKRKNLVRIYDKGAEIGQADSTLYKEMTDWIRVELQIMGKKATSTAKTMAESGDVKLAIIGIIRDVVDFPTITAWNNLTSDINKIKMSSIPKTQGDTEAWLMNQVVPSLARVIILNADFWVQFQLELMAKVGEN